MTHNAQTALALLGLAIVAALSLPFGIMYLVLAARRATGNMFGTDSRGEAFTIGLTFLACGAVLAYMLLLAVGIVPETHAQHLVHWHASAGVGLLAVAYPRETPAQYTARVADDYLDALAAHTDLTLMASPFSKLSDDAYLGFVRGYMDRATFDVCTPEGFELLYTGLVDDCGSVSVYGRHVAAHVIVRSRAQVLLAALGESGERGTLS